MAQSEGVFRILLVDDDQLLRDDIAQLNSAPLHIRAVNSPLGLCTVGAPADVLIVNINLPGAMLAIEKMARIHPAQTIIAIGHQGVDGFTLEYSLLQAELRGASASAPKAISGREIVALALETSERDNGRRLATRMAEAALHDLPGARPPGRRLQQVA
jgi:hypothetical protein